ncbi:ABC transporter substrate-binding protein [Caldimonas brevitalea]|uniref:Sulfonate transport system substrate-binding protein n=1 Tax=Caldimonas brevitalea TaxID=413882 RepID=A0A0G3BJ41_9BURK|nr:ABC transporter substrate-binding protein [Caldimonas brevitalea]AKJ29387.1 sulfonate transport system substrate-binding protein [Caldimonas brevitalea]
MSSVRLTRRVVVAAIALAAGAPALLGAPRLAQARPARPKVVRFGVSQAGVGTPPRSTSGWTAVAQTRRYVEQALAQVGVPVEWIFFKGQGPAVNEAMSNDQLDFTTLGDLPSIIGRSVGIKAKLAAVTSKRGNHYVAVHPDAPLRTVADLRGKRIGLHKGTASQLAANRILEAHGLTERDVKIINLEPAASLAAFQTRDIDATFGTLSLLTLRDKGLARVLYTTRHQPVATGQGHVLVSERFSAEQPELAQRVVTALVSAAHYASLDANRQELLKLWASSGSATEATYDEEYRGALAPRMSPRFDPFAVARIQQGVADAYRFKLIRRSFDVGAWIEPRYVEAAVAQLKLDSLWPAYDAQGHLLTATPQAAAR